MGNSKSSHQSISQSIIIISWGAMFLTSSLAIIFWREIAGKAPFWWPLVHLSCILGIFIATLFYHDLKCLRGYVIILLVIFLLGFGGGWQWGIIYFIRNSEFWLNMESSLPWALSGIFTHLIRLLPAIVIIIILFTMGRRRADLFLVKGDINAPAEPTKILGLKEPKPWPRLAIPFLIIFSFGIITFLVLTSGYSINIFLKVLPLIPIAILIAAINAFNEEFTLRAAPLSETWKTLGKNQSLILTTIFFGIGHYYGVPNGIIGVLLSAFLGWFLGKSILETKGFFWAWFIHFITDIPIFTFYAMSTIL